MECFGPTAGCASLLDEGALAFGRCGRAGVDCVISAEALGAGGSRGAGFGMFGGGLGLAVAWPQVGGGGIMFGFCWAGGGKGLGFGCSVMVDVG